MRLGLRHVLGKSRDASSVRSTPLKTGRPSRARLHVPLYFLPAAPPIDASRKASLAA